MSLWSDIQDRNAMVKIRKERIISEKEDLANWLIEELKKESDKNGRNLSDILEDLKRVETNTKNDHKESFTTALDNLKETVKVEIKDNQKLLSDEEIRLLRVSLILEFKLWDYNSLEEMLKKLNVHIIIDPREPINKHLREIPSELQKAKDFWEDQVRNNPEDSFAWKMLQEIQGEIKQWQETIILGLYDRKKKIILLFPNNMKKVNKGGEMDKLLVSTLVHEAMHAYFDRAPLDKFPYVYSTEEPMAEFGMLLYLKETHMNYYFSWAEAFVAGKKSCYRYGYALMKQYEKEETPSRTRRDLELYKVIWPTFIFSTPTSSVKKSGRDWNYYQINGSGQYSMPQVIEEYVKFKLGKGLSFNNIQNAIHSIPHVGRMFISTNPNGVSIHKGRMPNSFNYKGTNYYISTQLKDKAADHNFRMFRDTVSAKEPAFIITRI